MYDPEVMKTVADISRAQARLRPASEAIWYEGRATTFLELDRRANACANALLDLGLKPGDRVACLAKNTDQFLFYWLGAIKAKVCLVGLNWRLAGPEITFILKDSEAKLLVCSGEFAGAARSYLDDCPALGGVYVFEDAGKSWPLFSTWIDAYPDGDPSLAPCDDDELIQLYTSGTTGLPKGVPLTQANYKAFFAAAVDAWADFAVDGSNLVAMPLFHVAGVNTAIVALLQGCRIVIVRELVPEKLLSLLFEQRINYAFLVPAVINALLLEPAISDADFSNLEKVFYGASPIAEDVLRRATETLGATFTQLYGMTESAGAGAYLSPRDHDPALDKLRSCGKAMPGVELKIVVADGATASPGEVGEIAIRSGSVMKGYWRRPEASRDTIDADGWLHTGDAGYFDPDGFLYIHDRVKDMIISGGENIYPAEVENALFSNPDVADAAVIGVPDPRWGEAVKAIIVLRDGVETSAAAIIAHCRGRIAGYKCPKSVDFTDALPRNASGKVLRRELRQPYWADHARPVG
jgi:fatty-acyl-CoA synthase